MPFFESGKLPPGDLVLLKIEEYARYLLSTRNTWTAVILLFIAVFIVYPYLQQRDPDTHPLLLARQATASSVRNPGESAVYRSLEVPHGFPLTSGLKIRDPGTPAWAKGRNGDLRDVWRQAVQDVPGSDETTKAKRSAIFTVLGKEEIVEHDLDDVTKEINIMGSYFTQRGAQRVAIYLPNSIQLLTTLFASSFYGQSAILIPFGQSSSTVIEILEKTKPDLLIAAAGGIPLADVLKTYKGLKQIIWVPEGESRHMDWSDVPEAVGGQIGISVWQDVIEDRTATADSSLPTKKLEEIEVKGITVVWQMQRNDPGQIVEFTQNNIVSAIAAQINFISKRSDRMSPADLFLPADSLTSMYPLVLTLTALYSNASIALNSVAGPGVNLVLAARSLAPTIIVASAETIAKTHKLDKSTPSGVLSDLSRHLNTKSLASGRFPQPDPLSSMSDHLKPVIGTSPGKLRLIYVSERVKSRSPPLSSSTLSDIRILLRTRIIYALTAPTVAGAVAQTRLYDYRIKNQPETQCSHFGAPLGSVEIKLVDTPSHKTEDGKHPKGEIVVKGPAVVGGETNLGVVGVFDGDSTLAYAY